MDCLAYNGSSEKYISTYFEIVVNVDMLRPDIAVVSVPVTEGIRQQWLDTDNFRCYMYQSPPCGCGCLPVVRLAAVTFLYRHIGRLLSLEAGLQRETGPAC